ncbi:MAG TPA: hypothetical protein PLD47_07565 [Aggregatilineales bacterium]|nr:hypothetical protein [Anaerolineales bacterium]HRE47564.1 hypothetical protein [Aggregatilineales bacterium]
MFIEPSPSAPNTAGKAIKKHYTTPKLTTYGTLAQLTHDTLTGTIIDDTDFNRPES